MPSSAAAMAARNISGPLFLTLFTFGLALYISIASASKGRSKSSGNRSVSSLSS